ncbi:MAG: DUF4900 domain-containing protein [Candidatus Omnitrophica bacterium]|nr:DUF4900 domain-containing protein [Candidatus Omnitrophota bacterium]
MRTNRGRQGEEGFVLITFYMVLAVVLILVGAMMTHAVAEGWSAQRSQASTQAFYLTEAALDQGYRWLQSQAGPPGGSAPFVINGGVQNLGNGQFLVTIDPDDANPTSYVKRYSIQGWASAGAGAAVRRTDMVVQVQSFAEFAYLTNSEISSSGSKVWFITVDHIEGPTHTNSQFSMNGKPTFDGLVSSVSASINYYSPPPPGGNAPNFNGGLQLNAPAKPYPASIPAALITAAASASGKTFNGNTTLTFLANGNIQVTNASAGLNNAVLPPPANGVVYVNGGTLTLQGTMKGQMTVAASGDINFVDSITYSDNPQTNPNSTDLLGVLAGGNAIISTSAPTNITVQASVMALNKSFTVSNYWIGPPKGTLTLYGGLNQANRGPVGTFSGSTGSKLSGYTKDYHYDTRLQNMIPPYFPLTGSYSTLSWNDESNT